MGGAKQYVGPLERVVEHVREKAKEYGVDVDVQKPPKGIEADLAFPIGYKLASVLKKSPEACAEEFAQTLEHPLIERADSIHGYVNVTLRRRVFADELIRSVLSGDFFAFKERGNIVIDYSSPNVAKPMHVGHLRSTVIGESLKRIFRALGYDVVGVNYLGDVGTQFGKLLYALRWADERALEQDPIRELLRVYVKFHEEAEKEPQLEEEARRIYAEMERGNEEYRKLWRKILELSLRAFNRIYRLLGVEFDVVEGESAYVERAKELAKELVKRGIAYVDTDGSIVVDLEKYGLGKDVLLKRDGSTLYLSRDLAALLSRVERYNPKSVVYVVGSEQKMHFKRLFKLAELLGVRTELVHVAFGLVHLPEGRISTRKGRVVFLEDVLNKAIQLAKAEMETRGGVNEEDARKIGVGAVIYAILKVEPEKEVKFEWSKILAFQGETGPYIQYAVVRARKILEKAGDWSFHTKEPEEEEWVLLRELSWYRRTLKEAARTYSPHLVARYLYDVSRYFHNFYERQRVLDAPKGERAFRLGLVDAFRRIAEHGAHKVLLEIPGRM